MEALAELSTEQWWQNFKHEELPRDMKVAKCPHDDCGGCNECQN